MMDSDKKMDQITFNFNGNGLEYFKIWIVNVVLTILTLGIYSAWATVRKRRYFYGNTEFGGTTFEYMATPWMILKGRLIAVGVLIVFSVISQFFPPAAPIFGLFLLVAAPWIIWNSFRFRARMSSFRNVRFSFKGALKSVYLYILLLPILPLLIAGLIAAAGNLTGFLSPQSTGIIIGIGVFGIYLIFPYVQAKFSNYYVNNSAFGQGCFEANITSGRFYSTYIKAFLMMVGLAFFIGIIAALSGSLVSFEKFNENSIGAGAISAIIFIYLVFILFGLWVRAYVSSQVRNYIYGSTNLDNRVDLTSTMTASGLFMLYFVNTIILIITVGLGYPWTAVRSARYHAANTQATVKGDLSGYITEQHAYQSSLGDELGDAFDLDMDVAL